MAIPSILTGAAGRALRTLEPVAGMGSHADGVLSGRIATNGTDVASALVTADQVLTPGAARSTINAAGADIAAALGSARKPAFSAELHAATRNLHGGIQGLGRASSIDELTRLTRSTHGAANEIGAAMDELRVAASVTARNRVVLGSLGLGGGLAGLASLANGRSGDVQDLAPGPYRPPATPDAPSGISL